MMPYAAEEKARIEADVTEDDAFWQDVIARFDKTIRSAWTDIFIAGAESVSTRQPGAKAMPAVLLPEGTDLEAIAELAIKNYTSPFYQQFAASTRTLLKNAILRSRREGLGVEYVLDVSKHLFGKERARTIAVTETTRLFGLGAQAAYEASGVQEWQWSSVRDFKVDPICAMKNGTRYPIGVPFEPAHTRCRCFPMPIEGEVIATAAAALGDKHLPGKHDQSSHGVGALAGSGSTADRAYSYLKKNYPEHTVQWAKNADWTYSTHVPLSKIDMGRRPGGARDPKRVEGIAQAVRDGKVKLSPVVLVQKSNGRYALADGYHRTKVFEKLGMNTAHAYIAKGVGDHGPWDKEMHLAKLNKELHEDYSLTAWWVDFRTKHLPGKHNQAAHAGVAPVAPGSAQETAMFGDLNNFSKIRASGNQQQLVDVVRYTGTSKEINGHLRGTMQLSADRLPEVKRQIGSMDMAIKGSPLTRNVTLYRGIKPEIIGRAKVGDKLHDPGFMSTSTNRQKSIDSFTMNTQTRGLVEIKALRGLPAFGADGSEGEVILPRGSSLRVTRIRNETVRGKPMKVVTAEVISAGI